MAARSRSRSDGSKSPSRTAGSESSACLASSDRLIQPAMLQVLQSSSGSGATLDRRRLHVVVDLDLEKFFNRVNHDGLMARVAAQVPDKRVLKLIRAFLNAGVMEDGLVRPVAEGTPQGGPLSPIQSNLVLDDLDKELARRGHRFCRYADDCNIYVRSHRAGERVMASVSQFLTNKLRLKVNKAKSAVARLEERKFLGFSISNDVSERRIAPKASTNSGADPRQRAEAIHLGMARLLRRLRESGVACFLRCCRGLASDCISRGRWLSA